MQSRVLVRTAFIVLLTAIAAVTNGADILLPWHHFSTFGFSATLDGRVTYANPAAQRAGLHEGDQIDKRKINWADRLRVSFLSEAPENTRLAFPLRSGRTVVLTSAQTPRSFADNVTDVLGVLALLLYIIVAALLVLLRPMPATWAFYLFSYTFCFQGTLAFEYSSGPMLAALSALNVGSIAVSPYALIVFALRFPSEHPKGTARLTERALVFGIAPLHILFALAILTMELATGVVLMSGIRALNTIGTALFGVGVVALLARYAGADSETRNRLQWIVAAFTLAFVPNLIVLFMTRQLGVFPPVWIINLTQVWEIIAPLAVAYTVLRHRLFDIRFVMSRALLYGIITSLTVGALALVDWGFGRWLAESRFALAGELVLALLIGIGITQVHKRIEETLNRVIFRAQTLALEALRRFGQEVDLIADPKRLLAQTFEALHSRVECEYVGIYTSEGASFALATPAHEHQPALLANDDFAVLRLRRWGEPFECDEPHHPLRGALLVPMTARTQLVGFVVCGPKRDRTHYLPEEIETLSALAHRTASAYAWLTMRGADVLTRGLDELGHPSTAS